MNKKQRFLTLRENEKIIKEICPNIYRTSGIYLFYRINEKNEQCFYVGQAKDLLQRTASHLMGRKQHIDKSIYVHKLYSPDNPNGWQLKVIKTCDTSQLDLAERTYIQYFLEKGCKSYNVAGGGQFDKAGDVGERFEVKLKNYRSGKDKGFEKARNQVKVYFEKYLDYSIKGKPNKIKEKKLIEFKNFICPNEEDNDETQL